VYLYSYILPLFSHILFNVYYLNYEVNSRRNQLQDIITGESILNSGLLNDEAGAKQMKYFEL
jgi:hypothetical protein